MPVNRDKMIDDKEKTYTKHPTQWRGMGIFFKGGAIAFLGVLFFFLKDYIPIGFARQVLPLIGIFFFLAGLAVSIIGMIVHWNRMFSSNE